jgi:hypothetical protein
MERGWNEKKQIPIRQDNLTQPTGAGLYKGLYLLSSSIFLPSQSPDNPAVQRVQIIIG